MNRFVLPAETWKSAVRGIADLAPLPELTYNEYDAADESDNSSGWGSVECKPPISLKHTEFSLKQFAKEYDSLTLVHSTSGRKYWWQNFSRKLISPLSSCRTD
jgi:hypothetical protein